jgi:hypothetical protein
VVIPDSGASDAVVLVLVVAVDPALAAEAPWTSAS